MNRTLSECLERFAFRNVNDGSGDFLWTTEFRPAAAGIKFIIQVSLPKRQAAKPHHKGYVAVIVRHKKTGAAFHGLEWIHTNALSKVLAAKDGPLWGMLRAFLVSLGYNTYGEIGTARGCASLDLETLLVRPLPPKTPRSERIAGEEARRNVRS